jgi:hypothetical protein
MPFSDQFTPTHARRPDFLAEVRHAFLVRRPEENASSSYALHGFERRERVYSHTVENSRDLARFAALHQPFYKVLYAQRLDVTPWRLAESS